MATLNQSSVRPFLNVPRYLFGFAWSTFFFVNTRRRSISKSQKKVYLLMTLGEECSVRLQNSLELFRKFITLSDFVYSSRLCNDARAVLFELPGLLV